MNPYSKLQDRFCNTYGYVGRVNHLALTMIECVIHIIPTYSSPIAPVSRCFKGM